MANLTKIILGLNIAAGIAGLLFGLSVIPGKVDTLSKSKAEEEKKADKAIEKLTKAETALIGASTTSNMLTTAEEKVRILTIDKSQALGDVAKLDLDKKTAVKEKEDAEKKALDLENQNKSLEAEKQSWATERKDLQDMATQLAAELEKLKPPAGPVKPEVPTVAAGDNVGKIANVDPRNGSIILNRGSAHGFKVGDQLNVFRNNKLIGRIEVTRLSGTNTGLSIAQRTEGLGVPAGAQFQVGDDLVKFQ